MGVELVRPWWLAALPLLAALLALARLPWWRAVRRLPPATGRPAVRREALRLGLRLGWQSLLVLALAGATLTRPLHRLAVVFVLDASASVAPVRDQGEAAVRTAAARLRRGDVAAVVAAADGAAVEEPRTARPLFSRLAAALPGGATDLAAGLRLGAALVPPGYTGRVVLVSDGRQTRGDAVAAARELAALGLTVDALPLGAAGPDVRLESLDLPETAYRGERSVLTARVHAGRPGPAALRIYRDDHLLLEHPVELRQGRQDVAVPLPAGAAGGEPGLHRYRVEVAADPAADGTVANNALGAIQRVVGPPRVLLVAGRPEAAGLLPAALQAGGAEVAVVGPPAVPADLAGWARFAAVALVDVPAEALPAGAMEQLEAYVRDLGRGLVMTGGADSFGPGGYANTPVERALPVYMDLRGRGRQPRVALVLVVDKSGSMSGLKMEMAKEAAVRSLRLMRPDDLAAVLAFDSVPQWVAPLTPLVERDRLERAVGSIFAGGGTEIYPALAAAAPALRDAAAGVKHLILLTDGMSASGGDYPALLDHLREARTTLSTVAVGDDADTVLLEVLARAGRGRYHFVADPQAIPAVFARETLLATRTLLVDARFVPAAASSGPLLRGLASAPPLDGYVAATPKERAEVVLVAPEGDPVLAAWQYGAGRAVAWTPDVAGRWSGAWAASPAGAALWGNVLSWLLPAQDAGDLAVRVEPEPDGAITVVAENRTGWGEVRPTRAALLGPGGRRHELELQPAGPGRYRARLPAPEPGAYVVQAAQSIGAAGGAGQDAGGSARGELQAETGWVAPYPAEFRDFGVDAAFLARVAGAGGGRVLGAPAEAVAPAARPAAARWPLWPLCLVLAAAAWPLEIAARRLGLAPAAALPQALRRRADRAGLPGGDGAATPDRDASAAPAPARRRWGAGRRGRGGRPAPAAAAAAATAQQLLERKRLVRDQRRRRREQQEGEA